MVVLPPTASVAENELGETESAADHPVERQKVRATVVIDLVSFIVILPLFC
jgi:hypothetical protein